MGDIPSESTTSSGPSRPTIAYDTHQTLVNPSTNSCNPSTMAVSSNHQGAPFYSQYNSLQQLQPRLDIARGSGPQATHPTGVSPGSDQGSSPFIMGGMAAALPEYNHIGHAQVQQQQQQQQQQQAARALSGASTPALVYQLQQNLHYSGQQSPPYQGQSYGHMPFPPGQQYPTAFVPAQNIANGSYGMLPAQQQRPGVGSPPYSNFPQQPQPYLYYPAPYGPQAPPLQQYGMQAPQHPGAHGRRSSMPSAQPTILSPSGDPIVLGGNATSARAYSFGGPGDPNMHGSVPAPGALPRASTDPHMGSIPRGPPRKPKQSGHALWVGNLPPGTTISDLKDHFSRDATKDIESLFFIAKSNCAFVNYRTETACTAAMHRFHDSRFHGVRLVCRLRRSSAAASGIPTGPSAMTAPRPASTSPQQSPSPGESDEPAEEAEQDGDAEPTHSPVRQGRVSEKFFIVKSLTLQDLELSARNGIWATQSHNEETLNGAYESADNVYLIFSANKSGEYFGYARMVSPIMEDATEIMSSLPQTTVIDASDAPKSIPTPATDFAPKGRIIDDSARGTIFWEADLSDLEEEDLKVVDDGAVADSDPVGAAQSFGKPFRVEWVSTNRLPFYRTRGLRNPWNANREVKIARDGTELETSVGRRLIQMFHRLGPSTTSQTGPPNMPMQASMGGPPPGPY